MFLGHSENLRHSFVIIMFFCFFFTQISITDQALFKQIAACPLIKGNDDLQYGETHHALPVGYYNNRQHRAS